MKINRVIIFVAVMTSLIFLCSKISQADNSSVPTDFLTIQAAINDADTVAGDIITVTTATHTETGIHITKSVTIEGLGIGSTSIQPVTKGAGIGFYVDADNVTIRDMMIEYFSQAVRFEMEGGTVDNTDLINIEFFNNASQGIEVHNATTVTNLVVESCQFTNAN